MPETGDKEGEMPKDRFFFHDADEDASSPYIPDLEIQWGDNPTQVLVNGEVLATPDRVDGLDALIATLKRARRAMLGKTTLEDRAMDEYVGIKD